MITFSIQHWEKTYPAIRWREPISVDWVGVPTTYACRVCVANLGLNSLSKHQWLDIEQANSHIATVHP